MGVFFVGGFFAVFFPVFLKAISHVQLLSVTCAECGAESTRSEPFVDIGVPVPADAGSPAAPLPPVPLASLLDAVWAPEDLAGANQFQCGACARLVDARRSARITTLPRILPLTLLRFQFDAAVRGRFVASSCLTMLPATHRRSSGAS